MCQGAGDCELMRAIYAGGLRGLIFFRAFGPGRLLAALLGGQREGSQSLTCFQFESCVTVGSNGRDCPPVMLWALVGVTRWWERTFLGSVLLAKS